MNDFLLFDPIFRVPFLTGLALAIVLSMVGALLRLRDEWLAALGLSHLAAVGGMIAIPLGWPALAGAFAAAALAMVLRATLPRVGNSHYAQMILIGWAGTLLIGSYMDHGQVIGESLLRGQLYFTRIGHLAGAAGLLLLVTITFKRLSARLLTARFFPDHYAANRIPVWPHRTGYALIVVAATVLGTVSIGAFPAFALLFIPPWVGFVLVSGWTRSVIASVLVGGIGYTAAFVLAMIIDLPFGPVLTAVLVLAAALRFLTGIPRRHIPVADDTILTHH